MKKILVIAAVMVFAVGTVYSQNLTLSGYFNTGLGVVVSDQANTDPYLKAFGVDSEQPGYRFRLNGAYNNEERTAGVRFRLQSQGNLTLNSGSTEVSSEAHHHTTSSGYLSLPYVYGFVNFFENKLSLTGGIVDDSTFTTADWWINDDVGEGLGLLIKATPIEGLNLGFGAYLISQQSGGSNNILTVGNGATLPNFGNIHLKLEDAKYVIGASYTMKDVFYLGGSFRLENKAGWGSSRQQSSQLMGDIRYLGMKDLTAIVAADVNNLQDFANNGTMFFSETFAYKINEEINVGLNAVQFLSQAAGTDPAFLFNVWGSYAIGDIIPRVDAVYFMGGNTSGMSAASNDNAAWHRKGFSATSGAARSNSSVISVRPSVRINVDSRTFLEIGNMFNFDTKPGSSVMSNAFYLDFRWNF